MSLSNMSCLYLLSVYLSLLLFEPIVLSEEHAYWKDHVHALVLVFVVVVLARDAVDALQLARVPRGYDDIVRVALAESLGPCEVPHRTEEDLVESYRVVADVVELRHIGLFGQSYSK